MATTPSPVGIADLADQITVETARFNELRQSGGSIEEDSVRSEEGVEFGEKCWEGEKGEVCPCSPKRNWRIVGSCIKEGEVAPEDRQGA